MTLSQTATIGSNEFLDAQLQFFNRLDNAAKKLLDKVGNAPKVLVERTIAAIKEKIENGMSLEKIEKSLVKFPLVLKMFQELKPTEKEMQRAIKEDSLVLPNLTKLEAVKKEKLASSLKNLENTGFLKETWEKIQKTAGYVVDGALSILKAIPKPYLYVGGALLLLFGSISGILSFLSLGPAITASESFGALTAMVPSLTPETFTSMVGPLVEAFSAAPVSVAVPF